MKVKLQSDAASQPQSCSNSDEETNSLSDNHYIVVKLEDEDPETEMDLSIFAPVESSEFEEEEEEDEEDELTDSSTVSNATRRSKNTRERDNQEDPAPLEKQSSRRSLKGWRRSRQTFLAEQRHKQSLDCSAANREVSVGLPSENCTFYQAAPPSDSARGPEETSGLHTAISPLAAMEPPVFPNAPVQSTSVVGEDQQNILLEVLNHCKFLHAAVQRLEQKIDRQMSDELLYETNQKSGPKRQASLRVEERQLSWSLAQRLGPPVQRNPRWIPPWKRGLDRADLQQADTSSLQPGKPPGGGRGRGRGRGRRGRPSRSQHQSQTHDPASVMSKPSGDELCTAPTDDPQSQVKKKGSLTNTGSKRQQKRKQAFAQVDGEKVELENMPSSKEAILVQANNRVMIGSPLRKVWIPQSVYKEVFKEVEPQKAVRPVLHALFPVSTLSFSAITGNPAKGIQQLDPNKIEALREFLAEMYPQFDVGVRSVTWAQCLGVINNITKDLKKQAEKTPHLPTGAFPHKTC